MYGLAQLLVECDREKDARRSLDARAVIHSSNESSNLLIVVMRVVMRVVKE